MPVKNAAAFLHACIDSIITQTEKHWELIAVDDGSTDASYSILKQYADEDRRIKAFRSSGTGIIDALRQSFENSSGSLITRMDADDRMAPDKLEVLKQHLMLHGKGHVATGQVKYFADTNLGDGYARYEKWLNNLTRNGSNFQDIYKECVIPSPCWMVFRDDLIKCEGFEPAIYPEDYDLCFRFYRENLKVIPCDSVLHYWRDHSDRTSRNDENYADNRFLELKIRWFVELDLKPEQDLIIWGAGAKGKRVAKWLQKREIPFRWVCNNPRKVGKHIYNKLLESCNNLGQTESTQYIILVANREEQAMIRQEVCGEVHWFC